MKDIDLMRPALTAAALVLLAGCQSVTDELGMGRRIPDESVVVARPTLALPQNYALVTPGSATAVSAAHQTAPVRVAVVGGPSADAAPIPAPQKVATAEEDEGWFGSGLFGNWFSDRPETERAPLKLPSTMNEQARMESETKPLSNIPSQGMGYNMRAFFYDIFGIGTLPQRRDEAHVANAPIGTPLITLPPADLTQRPALSPREAARQENQKTGAQTFFSDIGSMFNFDLFGSGSSDDDLSPMKKYEEQAANPPADQQQAGDQQQAPGQQQPAAQQSPAGGTTSAPPSTTK